MFTIYGKDNCAFCLRAKALLDEKGLKYDYIDINENDELKKKLMELVPNAKTVPQIFEYVKGLGDMYVGGFKELSEHLGQGAAFGRR